MWIYIKSSGTISTFKKKICVKNNWISVSLYIKNYIQLEREEIGVRHYSIIKSFDINNCLTFLLIRSLFLNYKDWKLKNI